MALLLLLPVDAIAATEREQTINYEPTFVYVDGSQGERVERSIQVRNQTLVDAAFTVMPADLAETPGASTAFDFVEIGSAPRGAGDWLDVRPRSFRLRAGTQRRVPVNIDIPEDASAGGHSAAVVFSVEPVSRTGQFDVAYTTGIPVLVTVDGPFTRDLRVSAQPDDRWRFRGGRAGWTVELRNDGDVHEIISGRIHLDSLLSGSSSLPLRPGILLPGERRTEHVRFDVRSAPDIYRTRVRIERLGAPAEHAGSERLFVVPIWLLVICAGAGIVVWARLRSRRRSAEHSDEIDDGFGSGE